MARENISCDFLVHKFFKGFFCPITIAVVAQSIYHGIYTFLATLDTPYILEDTVITYPIITYPIVNYSSKSEIMTTKQILVLLMNQTISAYAT